MEEIDSNLQAEGYPKINLLLTVKTDKVDHNDERGPKSFNAIVTNWEQSCLLYINNRNGLNTMPNKLIRHMGLTMIALHKSYETSLSTGDMVTITE